MSRERFPPFFFSTVLIHPENQESSFLRRGVQCPVSLLRVEVNEVPFPTLKFFVIVFQFVFDRTFQTQRQFVAGVPMKVSLPPRLQIQLNQGRAPASQAMTRNIVLDVISVTRTPSMAGTIKDALLTVAVFLAV